MPAWRLLYVDGDREARLLVHDLFSGHHMDLASTVEEVRELRRRNKSYDVYIIGAGGPDSQGIELCTWLHRVDPHTPIVFCSSNGTARYEQAAVAAGALRFHLKPVDPKELFGTLNLLLKLAEFESVRAKAAAEEAIRTHTARGDAAPELVRLKAYCAFRRSGGNRINFERMWTAMLEASGTANTSRK